MDKLILDVDFRTGSFKDRIDNTLPGFSTYHNIDYKERGLCFVSSSTSNSGLQYKTIIGGYYSVVIAFKSNALRPGAWSWIMHTGSGVYNGRIGISNLNVLYADTGVVAINGIYTTNPIHGKYILLTVGGMYMSGSIRFNSYTTIPSTNLPGQYLYWRIYDGFFSDNDVKILNDEFNRECFIRPELYPKQYVINKPKDLSRLKDNNLALALNMIKVNDNLVDISGNAVSIIKNKIIQDNNGIKLDGINSYFYTNSIAIGMEYTFMTRVKINEPAGITRYLLNSNNIQFSLSSNKLHHGFYNGGWYNGVATTINCPLGHFINIVLTISRPNILSKIYINGIDYSGGNPNYQSIHNAGGLYFFSYSRSGNAVRMKAEIEDVRFYNRVCSLQEAKDYNNSFVNPTLVEDFSSNGADYISKIPLGWLSGKTTGPTWNINEWIGSVLPLPNFKIGTKFIKSASTLIGDGAIISIPSKQAYGTWQWDFYCVDTTRQLNITFISLKPTDLFWPGNSGYNINEFTDEVLYLCKDISTYVSVSSISLNTWYGIKITRDFTGTFNVYLRGGSFGNSWTLVGSPWTDNTITTSEYFVIYTNGDGNCVTNIKLLNGIIQ